MSYGSRIWKIGAKIAEIDFHIGDYSEEELGFDSYIYLLREEKAKLIEKKAALEEKMGRKGKPVPSENPPGSFAGRKRRKLETRLAEKEKQIAGYDEEKLGFDSYHDQLKDEAKLLREKIRKIEEKAGRKKTFWKLAIPILAAAFALLVFLNQFGILNISGGKPSGAAKPQPKQATEETHKSTEGIKVLPGPEVPGIGRFIPGNTVGFSQAPAKSAQGLPEIGGSASQDAAETFTVPNGGGFWHIGQKIAKSRLPEFKYLPTHERDCIVATITNYLIENQARLGISKKESMPGNRLFKGADLSFGNKDWQEVLSRLPKRVLDATNSKLPHPSGPAGKAVSTTARAVSRLA